MMLAFKKTMIAAGLLALTAGVASAAPAVAENDVNLRAGPGTSYGVVDVLPRGANVEVQDCDGGWCHVNYDGRIGYSSQRYLNIDMASSGPMEPRDYAYRSGYRGSAYSPGYRDFAYAPGYRDYGPAPRGGYDVYYDQPAPLPNPLDFPLLPWNW